MSGIANFGSFAGGLMRGHLAATEEQRREEDQAFQKEQRAAWQEEQSRQKRVREGIAGLARPGAETGRTQFMMEGIDGPEALPGAYTINRQTDDGFLRGLADLYYKEGMPEQAIGAEERGFTLRERDRMLGQRGKVDAALARRAAMIKEAQDDPSAFMAKYGPQFNADMIGGPKYAGMQVALASAPNGSQIAYMMDSSGKTVGSMPVTAQTISDFINTLTDADLSAASSDMYDKVAGRGLQRRQLGATEMTAQAAMRNAEANEGYRQWLQGRPTLTQGGDGRIYVTDSQGNLLRTLGNPRPGPGAGLASRPNIRTAMITVPDPTTNKPTKVPVNVVTQLGPNNVPIVNAYTMDGKPVKDNKLLSQLAGGDLSGGEQDPQLAALSAQTQRLLANMTGDNYGATQDALKDIDRQRGLIVLKRQIAELTPDERVPEASNLLKQGASPEALQQLGFTQEEVRAARKYRPPAQTPTGGPATSPPTNAPGERRVSSLSAEEAALPVSERTRLGLARAREQSTTGTDTRSVTERLFGR